MGGKGAAFFGDEFGEEIGLPGGDEFLDLFFRDLALQDHVADAERAGLLGGDSVLAGVGIIERIDLALLANRAETKCFVPRWIDRNGATGLTVLEFELGLELFAEFNGGG